MKRLLPISALGMLLLGGCATAGIHGHNHTLSTVSSVREEQMIGSFYSGDGLGMNHTFILNEDRTFTHTQFFCTGSTEPETGERWFVRNGHELVLKYQKDENEEIVFRVARVDGKLSFYDPKWAAEIAANGARDFNVFQRLKKNPSQTPEPTPLAHGSS
jgi:hypothetical protein